MMKGRILKRIVAICCGVCMAGTVRAGIEDVRINEILVYNTDSYEDDYGHRVSWLELHNAGYSPVNVGGAWLKAEGKAYRIPKNDPRTVIPPRGYLIFFNGGAVSKGTFHTNFRLEESDWVGLYGQSGSELIDSLWYGRANMVENVSYGWFLGHDGKERLEHLPVVTPAATNDTLERIPRDELFRQEDPSGVVMALTAMSVVFCALLLLFLAFKGFGKFNLWVARRKAERAHRIREWAGRFPKGLVSRSAGSKEGIPGEELAAIALALHQYSEDLHDIEKTVLTINRVARAYSPWSSKIYGLRKAPNRR